MKNRILRVICLFSILATNLVAVGCGTKSTATPYVAEEFAICTNASEQGMPGMPAVFKPAVSGNTVVWMDRRNGNFDIYGYDLTTGTEFPICTNTSDQFFPAISGNTAVWMDRRNGNWDLYGYDLTTGTEFPICTNASEQGIPAISGNTVVWTDKRNGNDDIYGFNLSSDTEFAICTNDSDQSSPAISGNIVVWSGGCDGDFNGYNLGTQEKFTINNFAPNGQAPGRFDISGDIVVWTDYRNDNPDIYGYNLSSGDYFAICTAPYSQSNPDISSDIAVWDDFRNGYGDIYGYNLKTGEEFAVCTNAASQDFPAISGNIVVWMDGRNGDSIYGARLTFDNK